MFLICELNVERFCSMLCSSPTSQNILSKYDISVPSEAVTKKPLIVISENNPVSFKVTVFPPVFGPVIKR